jgi:uncharacterized membrane protein
MTNVGTIDPNARFEFGRVVGQTFALIGRNFFFFLLTALIFVGVPQFAAAYFQGQMISNASGDVGAALGANLGVTLLGVALASVLQGMLTRASFDDLSGKGVAMGAAIGDGLRYFFPLVLLGILLGLGVMLGFILLIIPGLILAVRWAVAAPALVIEGLGPTTAMGRSAELSKGSRWPIFGLLLLYVLLSIVVQFGAMMLIGVSGFEPVMLTTLEGMGLVVGIVTAASTAIVTLISSVGTAAIYFELRRVTEGMGISDIAAVFD